MRVPQQNIPLIDPKSPGMINKPWLDFFRSLEDKFGMAIPDDTYDIDGAVAGTVETLTTTNGIITGVTLR